MGGWGNAPEEKIKPRGPVKGFNQTSKEFQNALTGWGADDGYIPVEKMAHSVHQAPHRGHRPSLGSKEQESAAVRSILAWHQIDRFSGHSRPHSASVAERTLAKTRKMSNQQQRDLKAPSSRSPEGPQTSMQPEVSTEQSAASSLAQTARSVYSSRKTASEKVIAPSSLPKSRKDHIEDVRGGKTPRVLAQKLRILQCNARYEKDQCIFGHGRDDQRRSW